MVKFYKHKNYSIYFKVFESGLFLYKIDPSYIWESGLFLYKIDPSYIWESPKPSYVFEKYKQRHNVEELNEIDVILHGFYEL